MPGVRLAVDVVVCLEAGLKIFQGDSHGLAIVLGLQDVAGGRVGRELPGLTLHQLVGEREGPAALVVGSVNAAGIAHALPRHWRPAHAAIQALERLQLPLHRQEIVHEDSALKSQAHHDSQK